MRTCVGFESMCLQTQNLCSTTRNVAQNKEQANDEWKLSRCWVKSMSCSCEYIHTRVILRGCLFDFLVYVQTEGRVVGGWKRKRDKRKASGDTEHERMYCNDASLLEDAHTRMQHNPVLMTTYRHNVITQSVWSRRHKAEFTIPYCNQNIHALFREQNMVWNPSPSDHLNYVSSRGAVVVTALLIKQRPHLEKVAARFSLKS